MMRAPQSRMDVLSPSELNEILYHSSLRRKYAKLWPREVRMNTGGKINVAKGDPKGNSGAPKKILGSPGKKAFWG